MSARDLRVKFVLALLLYSVNASAQSFRIQIIDGKSGKPLANQRFILLGDNPNDSLHGPDRGGFNTDENGLMTISDPSAKIQTSRVYVEGHHPCSKSFHDFPLAYVLKDGLVSENTCNPSIKRAVTPGTLVLFVRDESFFEKMAH